MQLNVKEASGKCHCTPEGYCTACRTDIRSNPHEELWAEMLPWWCVAVEWAKPPRNSEWLFVLCPVALLRQCFIEKSLLLDLQPRVNVLKHRSFWRIPYCHKTRRATLRKPLMHKASSKLELIVVVSVAANPSTGKPSVAVVKIHRS